ncbi:aromatic acid exporter family protein [Streptomyces sp. NPDC048845]|uniref:FUSC family protein n=1 Tax=Streptomyces sp. NPDC048845 TaxID=3155390 RepID=UPI003421AC15
MDYSRSLSSFVRTESSAVARAARNACSGPGRERDLVIQALKAAAAAILAWIVSSWLLADSLALMAPWVAVVLVQATVYRSVAQGVQQLLAIAFGTVLATGALALLGHPVAAMAVVLPLTVLVGNWPRLGHQGIYSATSALFTVSAGEASAGDAGERLLAALLGAAIGIGINALVRPPSYLRDSRKAVGGVVDEVGDILDEIADGMEEPWEYERAVRWYDRAHRLPGMIRDVRTSLAWSRESTRLNPERRWKSEISRLTPAYEEALETLAHVADHVGALTRNLLDAADRRTSDPQPGSEVTGPYAGFLRRVATAVRAYGRSVDGPESAREELGDTLRSAGSLHDTLRRELPRWATGSPEAVAVFGSLLMEARRLSERLVRDGAGDDGGSGDGGESGDWGGSDGSGGSGSSGEPGGPGDPGGAGESGDSGEADGPGGSGGARDAGAPAGSGGSGVSGGSVNSLDTVQSSGQGS